MIRRYNYTGRKKLLSKKVHITESTINGVRTFNAKCDFKDLDFPDEARVFIEPYFKSSFMRFDFGTVARFQAPTNTDTNDLPTTDKLRYRIKIVDGEAKHGMILGFADIEGVLTNDPSGGRQAILPVDFIDLGKRIWTLEFRSTGPVLAVNSSIDNIREKVKSDDAFFSLVYPEIIRRIALKITESDEFEESDLSGWQAEWVKFFREVLQQTDMPRSKDDDVVEDWCNDVSDAFSRKYQVIQRFTNQNML